MSQRPTPCAFIDDSYTQEFVIDEIPGVSMGIRGQYRPMTAKQVTRFIMGLDPAKYEPAPGMVNRPAAKPGTPDVADKLDNHQSSSIAAQIVSWDLLNQHGQPVPITADSISRINPPSLLAQLVNTITGLGQRSIEGRVVTVVRDQTLTNEQKLEKIAELLELPDDAELEDTVDAKN